MISDDCTVVAFADGFSTAYETMLNVPGPGFVANDILDCPLYEPFEFSIQTGPAHGTLVDDGDGGFEYQPDQGFSGLDSFVYNVRGGAQSLLMAKGIVSIVVGGQVCAAVDDSYTTAVDQSMTIPAPGVLGNDTLCDDFQLISVDQQPGHGQVMLHPGGDFDYVPDPGYVGQDSFTYQLQTDLDSYSEVLTAATVLIDVSGRRHDDHDDHDDGPGHDHDHDGRHDHDDGGGHDHDHGRPTRPRQRRRPSPAPRRQGRTRCRPTTVPKRRFPARSRGCRCRFLPAVSVSPRSTPR